jgi:primosomal protein N' (replication factor Y) (superfamily II helicase)
VSLPHLDRPFDYLVPEELAAQAVPGCRVRVRFAGRLTSGFLLDRAESSEHQGKLGYLERVVSPERVLTPEIAALARAVADRYGGTLADVLRLAIPPRHAGAEVGTAGPGTAAAELAGRELAAAVPGGAVGAGAAAGGAVGAGAVGAGAVGAGAVGAGPGTAAVELAGRELAAAVPGGAVGAGAVPGGAVGAGAVGAGAVPPPQVPAGLPGSWARYRTGPSFLAALAGGRSPRAVWSALPGPGWADEIALAVAACASSGRGALVVVPDTSDLELVDAALARALPPGAHVVLAPGLGPAERYRRWLAVARGEVRTVAGTRSAVFAPVADLGLAVLWDEGNDLHAEPRAPYPHAREVLALRAHLARAGALVGGFGRSAEAALLAGSGWAKPLVADRQVVRQYAPGVVPSGDESELARDEAARSARLPGIALRTAREALASGPVLFQVPRRGYLTAVACEQCRAQARCECGGPGQLATADGPLRCGWCGAGLPRGCRRCGHEGLRALVTGAVRTAEELRRAFPSVPVRESGGSGGRVTRRVGAGPAVVVATPGAEPVAERGYSAAVLVDGWAMLGLPSLRAAEEALRRWLNAAALVRPAVDGGKVVVVADSAQPAVQALVRWDPATFADRELAERAELRFPPTVRMAALTGPASAVQGLLDDTVLPAETERLGPLPGPATAESGQVSILLRVPRADGAALALALRAGQAARSASKAAGAVRVQLDPAALL